MFNQLSLFDDLGPDALEASPSLAHIAKSRSAKKIGTKSPSKPQRSKRRISSRTSRTRNSFVSYGNALDYNEDIEIDDRTRSVVLAQIAKARKDLEIARAREDLKKCS